MYQKYFGSDKNQYHRVISQLSIRSTHSNRPISEPKKNDNYFLIFRSLLCIRIKSNFDALVLIRIFHFLKHPFSYCSLFFDTF